MELNVGAQEYLLEQILELLNGSGIDKKGFYVSQRLDSWSVNVEILAASYAFRSSWVSDESGQFPMTTFLFVRLGKYEYRTTWKGKELPDSADDLQSLAWAIKQKIEELCESRGQPIETAQLRSIDEVVKQWKEI